MNTKALQVQKPNEKPLTYDDTEIKTLWAEDKLQRIDVARKLTSILAKVRTNNDGFTLVIKSPWGTGKTFFVEKWRDTLKKQGMFCVYFSAWEAEIQRSPAAYFLQTFIEAFEQESDLHSELDSAVTKGTLQILPIFLTLLTIACLPAGAVYALLAKLFGDVVAKTCSTTLKKLEKKQSIEESILPVREAKKHLSELMKVVAESSFDGKVYIFVDELDRCKPDFAIKILEEIKHFFCLPNLVFVLSVDFEQLEGSIKHVYGKHIDCEGYLMRFVNLFYTLPSIPHELFAKYLFHQLPINTENKFCIAPEAPSKEPLIDLFSACSDAFKASLRDQIMIKNRLELMLQAGKVFLYPTVYLLFAQLRYPAIWQRALKNGLFSVSPKALHRTLETYQKELNNDFARESTTTLYQTEITLFKLELPDEEASLLSELIRLLSAKKREEIVSIMNEKDPEYSAKRHAFVGKYWRYVFEHQKDFFTQLDLINLYSDGFA